MPAPDLVPQLPPGMPLTLTVAEAADWLRVSKSSVYGMIHRWEATGGDEGIPRVRLGLERTWRVPTIAVLRLVGLVEATPPSPPESDRVRHLQDHGAA